MRVSRSSAARKDRARDGSGRVPARNAPFDESAEPSGRTPPPVGRRTLQRQRSPLPASDLPREDTDERDVAIRRCSPLSRVGSASEQRVASTYLCVGKGSEIRIKPLPRANVRFNSRMSRHKWNATGCSPLEVWLRAPSQRLAGPPLRKAKVGGSIPPAALQFGSR